MQGGETDASDVVPKVSTEIPNEIGLPTILITSPSVVDRELEVKARKEPLASEEDLHSLLDDGLYQPRRRVSI